MTGRIGRDDAQVGQVTLGRIVDLTNRLGLQASRASNIQLGWLGVPGESAAPPPPARAFPAMLLAG